MSERFLRFSLDMFQHPVFVCDKDGCIAEANEPARTLMGSFFGKHAARFSPEVGDALAAFRIRGDLAGGRVLKIRDRAYSAYLYPAEAGTVVMLVPQSGVGGGNRLKCLEMAFDSSMDGIWVAGADARVCAINKASERLNSVRARQVLGRSCREVVAEGLIDRSVTLEVLKRKRQISFVQHILPTQKYLHVTGTPHYDEQGGIEYVVVIERDVTDLKNMRSSMDETRLARDKARELLTEISLKNTGESDFVAASPGMRLVADMGLKIGRLGPQCMLITGESGAGRHSLARYVHRNGIHAGGPFMNVNCAAIPPAMQDSELFGHSAGAAPGSGQAQAGVLALAEKGTLMLDDIDKLPLQTQAKLLCCLDDGHFMPLGSRKRKKMECSLMATSREDLGKLAGRGLFREDLYRRLAMFSLHVPPLRERSGDIPELARLFLDRANDILNMNLELGPEALDLLQQHAYPGNTHELEAVIMKASAVSDGQDLSQALRTVLAVPPETLAKDASGLSLPERLDDLEREMLAHAREACRNTREMGEMLGISQSGVMRRLRKHGMAAPEKKFPKM